MSLADILEEAASALPGDADVIRPANGDPFLLLEGLDAEGAGRVLDWVLRHDADGAVELSTAWADAEGGPDVLAAIDESALPKPGRKALRRALHRLRSQGVSLPVASRAEPVVSRLPEIVDEISSGFVSALDPRGGRLVYLMESNPAGGARLFEILLDETRGVIDFDVYAAGRSRIRRFVREALERTRFPAVEVAPDAIRALVARIASAHPADRALPRQFSEWRSKVAVQGATPGDLAVEELSTSDQADGQADGLARAAEMVSKGALGPWGPPAQALAEVAQQRLEAAAEADPAEDDALWRELAEPIAGGARADAYVQCFRESAYVLWKLEREDEARACLSAAEAFEGRAASDNPVAIAVVEALLSQALEGLRKQSAPASDSGAEE